MRPRLKTAYEKEIVTKLMTKLSVKNKHEVPKIEKIILNMGLGEDVNDNKKLNSTQKPVELVEFFLKYYTMPGWMVLDPTMGSGTTGIACKRMGRNFIGIEKDELQFNQALKRIEEFKINSN